MMVDHYGYKFSEAEKLKIEPNWPVDCDDDVIAPFINMTVNHLRFDFRMFNNAPNNIKIEKVILTGGCQLLPELVTQLAEQLELNVEIADPFIGFEYKNESDKKRNYYWAEKGAFYLNHFKTMKKYPDEPPIMFSPTLKKIVNNWIKKSGAKVWSHP